MVCIWVEAVCKNRLFELAEVCLGLCKKKDLNTHDRESMVSDTHRTESNTPHAQAPIRHKNDLHVLLAILAATAGTVSHR